MNIWLFIMVVLIPSTSVYNIRNINQINLTIPHRNPFLCSHLDVNVTNIFISMILNISSLLPTLKILGCRYVHVHVLPIITIICFGCTQLLCMLVLQSIK